MYKTLYIEKMIGNYEVGVILNEAMKTKVTKVISKSDGIMVFKLV